MIIKNQKNNEELIQLKYDDIPGFRKKILKEQNGLCLISKRIPDRPVLDHAHKKKLKLSGRIRGVIDSGINILLGKIENSCIRCNIKLDELPFILRNMADYLEMDEYPFLHPAEAPTKSILSKRSFNELKKLYSKKYPKRKPLILVVDKNNRSKQKLNKTLKKLYNEFNLEPKFYKKNQEEKNENEN